MAVRLRLVARTCFRCDSTTAPRHGVDYGIESKVPGIHSCGRPDCLEVKRQDVVAAIARQSRNNKRRGDSGRHPLIRRCDICGEWTEEWVIDHDHECRGRGPFRHNERQYCVLCIRGLLCQSCNHGLGRFKDDAQTLRRAAHYLGWSDPSGPEAA